jgi:hypothetical protein
LTKLASRNDAAWSVEKATPLKLAPPGPNKRLSGRLPESLKPTATSLPHHAVEVSL